MHLFYKVFIVSSLLILAQSCDSGDSTEEIKEQFFTKETEEDNYFTALQSIDNAIAQNPDDIELLLNKAKLAKANLDFKNALDAGAKAFVRDSTNIDARKIYAWTLINKPQAPVGDIDRAKRHYKYVLSVEPDNLEIMIEYANAHALTGDFESSFKLINDVLRKNDKYRDAYILKGSNYKVIGNYELALSSYQTAVMLDPNYFMVQLQTGYLLSEMENHGLAIEYYRNAADLDPKSIEALYGVAKSLQDMGEFEKAQAAYREILAVDESFFIAYFNQGFIKQHLQNQPDSAVYYYNLCLDTQPEYVKAWYQLGETYITLDRNVDAARAFAEALTLNPDYEPALIAKDKLRPKLRP